MAELAFHNHSAKDIEHDPAGKLSRIFVHIVRRCDLDNFHATQPLASDQTNHFKRFPGKQAAWLR